MPNLRSSKSIDDTTIFGHVLGDYVDSTTRMARLYDQKVDEKAPAMQVEMAAEEAAYAMLVALINSYCAERIAATLKSIRLEL